MLYKPALGAQILLSTLLSWTQAAPQQPQQPSQQTPPETAQPGTTPAPAASPSSQQPAASGATGETKSPAAAVGLFAYPRNQQSPEQQAKDEQECFGSARQQTGIDPFNPTAPTTAQGGDSSASGPKGGGAKGAAGGAAAGAAIGGIAGDAGQGAAIGATAGAMHGRRQQKKAQKAAEKEAKTQQEQQAQSANQQQVDTFRRSMSACLDARDYSVK